MNLQTIPFLFIFEFQLQLNCQKLPRNWNHDSLEIKLTQLYIQQTRTNETTVLSRTEFIFFFGKNKQKIRKRSYKISHCLRNLGLEVAATCKILDSTAPPIRSVARLCKRFCLQFNGPGASRGRLCRKSSCLPLHCLPATLSWNQF